MEMPIFGSIGSLIIYFINCYGVNEFCLTFEDKTVNVDLFFNIFFLLYFGLRMENTGDPWLKQKNSQNLTYFECLYLIMVTMSTVGYGDIIVKTTLGRGFILFFIVAGLILFANLVPEMADIVGSTRIYRGSYEAVKGRKFIVICGNINLNSVTAFIKDFLAQASGDVATEMVFLGEALSIKNHFPSTRVIIQIIQSSNKLYLPKLPNWEWKKGDSVICFAELKLGLIAQSCLVPGLTTVLTSLFVRESSQQEGLSTIHQYEVEGEEYKVMTQLFSPDFVDMSFKDACRLCYVKLNLILLAIEYQTGPRANSILINPSSSTKIDVNTMGFFIAGSVNELSRARNYCKHCHNHIMNPELIGKCRCKGRKTFSISGNLAFISD
ncbi:hypothetical protein JD844_031238 [Phrynosoma platyrhinos]|uniref:Potassium channel subfamily U member 1 n=1 Tax=Phrynosoma platyrhinos TaxID=52577 RepID=A0ABQ7T0W5_PHRPL|nr:hypothetical protein JD844_031238 [Phrynosoma platyrhinos]